MRYFLIFVFCLFGACFAQVLDNQKAFVVEEKFQANSLILHFEIDKSAYLYKNRLKFIVSNNDIGDYIDLPKHELKDDNEVFTKSFEVAIPNALLQSFGDQNKFILKYQGCANSGFCYQPVEKIYDLDLIKRQITLKQTKFGNTAQNAPNLAPNNDKFVNLLTQGSFLWILLCFFGFGAMLSLTPCVYPMIPILSAIILIKSKKEKNTKNTIFVSLIYVLSMSITYAIAGILSAFLGNSIQAVLQNKSVIIFTALIFVFLAFVIFYGFSSGISNKFQNLIDQKIQKFTGVIGVIFMGILSALIVSPCMAAPLAGVLLYIAQTKDMILGGFSLFAMGLGMGVLLVIIGIFGKFMPKPGEWMREVQKIFGFLMLFMAIWILGRILNEEIVNLLYGVLMIFTAVFLGLNLRMQSVFDKIIKSFCIVILVFGVILVANFGINKFMPNLNQIYSSNLDQNNFKFVDNINDLNNIIQNSNKLILIDFWASWCENCKDFEKIFEDEQIKSNLGKFTLIKIDLSQNSPNLNEITNKFNIFGPPAMLILKDTNEIAQFIQAPKKEDFLIFISNL